VLLIGSSPNGTFPQERVEGEVVGLKPTKCCVTYQLKKKIQRVTLARLQLGILLEGSILL
jgi:hypothetical protein